MEAHAMVDFYLGNAKVIADGIRSLGFQYTGGVNSPYIWFKTPGKFTSWEFFDLLLNQSQVVTTPGSGFGLSGEGYIRVSSFGKREDVVEAVERLKKMKI